MTIIILPTDTTFADSPDAGPDCLCSRCQQPILDNSGMRVWLGESEELRYHPNCLGLPADFEDDEELVFDWKPEDDGSEEESLDLGACCCCDREDSSVRNIVNLPFKAPVLGTGWGCLVCKLPLDGATAVYCDQCIDENREPRNLCYGDLLGKKRIPRSCVRGDKFDHDMSKHEAEEALL